MSPCHKPPIHYPPQGSHSSERELQAVKRAGFFRVTILKNGSGQIGYQVPKRCLGSPFSRFREFLEYFGNHSKKRLPKLSVKLPIKLPQYSLCLYRARPNAHSQ